MKAGERQPLSWQDCTGSAHLVLALKLTSQGFLVTTTFLQDSVEEQIHFLQH